VRTGHRLLGPKGPLFGDCSQGLLGGRAGCLLSASFPRVLVLPLFRCQRLCLLLPASGWLPFRGPSWLLVSLVIVSLLALRKFQFEWRTRNDFLFVGVYFQFPISVISFEQNHLEMRTCSVEACQNFIEQSSEMRNHFPGDLVRSMYSNFCWASALSHRSAVPVRHFPSMCR